MTAPNYGAGGFSKQRDILDASDEDRPRSGKLTPRHISPRRTIGGMPHRWLYRARVIRGGVRGDWQMATTSRAHLAGDPPLGWTRSRIWTQVGNLLALDVPFDTALGPRRDSRELCQTD